MEIMEVLQTVATLVVGALAIYFKYSEIGKKKMANVSELIADLAVQVIYFIQDAEDTYKDVTNAGGEKFEMVCDRLFEQVPEGLNLIITREFIEDMVQTTFDKIEEYAKVQMDKVLEDKKGE